MQTSPPLQNPVMTGRNLANFIAPAGDVNGDGFADFLVDSMNENGSTGGAYLFYGCGNGMNNSTPTAGCPSTGIWGVPAPPTTPPLANVVVNGPSCTGSGCNILFFVPQASSIINLSGGWAGYYWGASTLGTVGDVNKDGFSDVFLGSWDMPRLCASTACYQYYWWTGGGVLFTGSSTGLVVNQAVTQQPSCTGGVCSPYWVSPSMTNWGVGGKPSFYQFGWGTNFGYPGSSDYNGDGYPDFVVYSPSYQNGAGTTALTGGLYFFQ
jgi:hypothetical protein